MVGRGAYGAPWMPTRIATYLATGRDPGTPASGGAGRIATAHVAAMLAHYGAGISACATPASTSAGISQTSGAPAETREGLAAATVHGEDARAVLAGLAAFYAEARELAA